MEAVHFEGLNGPPRDKRTAVLGADYWSSPNAKIA